MMPGLYALLAGISLGFTVLTWIDYIMFMLGKQPAEITAGVITAWTFLGMFTLGMASWLLHKSRKES